MRIILVLIGVTLCASSSISLRNTEDDADAGKAGQCQEYCTIFQRECFEPPYICGACFTGLIDKDGECLPLKTKKASPQKTTMLAAEDLRAPDSDIEQLVSKHSETADINTLPQDIYDDTGQSKVARGDDDANASVTQAVTATTVAPPKAEGQNQDHNPGGNHPHPVSQTSGPIFIAVVAGCSVAGLVGLVIAGVCWYRLRKNVKAASEVDYPAYGVTGPSQDKVGSPGDRKLAQSAQMYHYQHQKQQMIAMEKANSDMNKDGSDADSDEENEEGDYTVFECPGLAPTGEMEVKNPLFNEDTPVTPAQPDLGHQ